MKSLKDQMRYYKKQFPAYESAIDLWKKVHELQRRIKRELSLRGEEAMAQRLSQGLSLLEEGELEMDSSLFFRGLRGLLNYLPITKKMGQHLFSALRPAEEREKVSLSYLTSLIDSLDEESEKTLAQALIHQGAMPFYQTVAEAFKEKIEQSQWMKPFCPVCGKRPSMARLRQEDGKRLLLCLMCETEWPFPRLQCPFCLSGQESLFYLSLKQDKSRKALVCKACKGYIKTLDMRHIPEGVPASLEDIVTFPLDQAAQSQGYEMKKT